MAELLRKPDKLSRVREEIRDVINEKGQVDESDIESLLYLQAVVKETLRLHPPAPFLLPHKAISDMEINGYLVPKDAEILTNVWASGRDPAIWTDAEEFMPERFLIGKHDHTDFRGKHFELIPFGSGRRSCPGFPLAYRMVHRMVATFAGNFEWKLDEGMKPEELDMEEKTALTLQKAIPLKAFPLPLDE